MTEKDIAKIEAAQSLIEAGRINSLQKVFKVVPISIVADALGMHYNTLYRRINQPLLLTTENYISIAKLLKAKPSVIFNLALNDIPKNKQ